jgi:hypothetical protein
VAAPREPAPKRVAAVRAPAKDQVEIIRGLDRSTQQF